MVHIVSKFFNYLSTLVFTIVEILISSLISVVIFPISIILILVNEIARLVVTVCLRMQFGCKVKLITDGTDTFWSFKKPRNSRTTITVTFYNSELEVEHYRELFWNRVINFQAPYGFKPYEKLTYIFTKHLGYSCWKKDENFNINNHVRYYPGSENRVITESELMEKILPELFVDMDESVPQWEEVIIPKFQYDITRKEAKNLAGDDATVCAKLFRYHHGYMDGFTNFLLFTTCMYGGKFPGPVDPLAPLKIPFWKRIISNLSSLFLGCTTILKSLYFSTTIKSRFATKNYSGKRIFSWSSRIDITLLHQIRTATKYSVPTIMTAAIGGALRKLQQKYPSTKEEFRNIPNEEIGGLVAAILPYPNVNLRNRFVTVPYPINTSEISQLQRLKFVNENLRKLKRSPIAQLLFLISKVFGRFPEFVVDGIMRNASAPITFSNVPLSNSNLKFWDNEVVEIAGWPPLLVDTGLSIVTIRYADYMRVCGVTDENCLSEKELKYFFQEIHTEIRLMLEECLDCVSYATME